MEEIKNQDQTMNANRELSFQNGNKRKWADELIIAYRELAFQNEEAEKWTAELIIANSGISN